MKLKVFIWLYLIKISGFSQIENHKESIFSSLYGPYLAQSPPSDSAEIFAPGMISTDEKEALYGIFKDGTYIIFDRAPKGFSDWENYPIYVCKETNSGWAKPVLTEHLGKPWYFNYPNPNNDTEIFYTWWLPLNEDGAITNIDIWRVRYNNGHWDKPEKLSYPINTPYFDVWPTVTKDGVLYFFSNRKGGFGSGDIYKSVPENSEYLSVENLGPKINTPELEQDPCISSDGSFLIFSSNRKGSMGKDDLYVTFKKEDGEWVHPINLGGKVNSAASENRPQLTPDEKYLFFTSTRNGNLDIFWIDAGIIKELILRGLK